MEELVREPAVAGRFYPGDAPTLRRFLRSSLSTPTGNVTRCLALLAPHAGYVYSGAIAAHTWARAAVPRSVILLCPNHTGRGARQAVWARGSWRIPGGELDVDEALARELLRRTALTSDVEAHRYEHAIEVHLPFLHARRSDASIVPICLGRLSEPECLELGDRLADVVRDRGGPEHTLIAASTDMSHYVPADEAARLDRLALERIEGLDPEGLYEVVARESISMCGFVPTTVALRAARHLGAREVELVRYGNSGETSGDLTSVVGYAGLLVR